MMPVSRQTPFPQYVWGTMSPYPMDRNVMEMSHMAPRKLLVTSCWSWYLPRGRQDFSGRSAAPG